MYIFTLSICICVEKYISIGIHKSARPRKSQSSLQNFASPSTYKKIHSTHAVHSLLRDQLAKMSAAKMFIMDFVTLIVLVMVIQLDSSRAIPSKVKIPISVIGDLLDVAGDAAGAAATAAQRNFVAAMNRHSTSFRNAAAGSFDDLADVVDDLGDGVSKTKLKSNLPSNIPRRHSMSALSSPADIAVITRRWNMQQAHIRTLANLPLDEILESSAKIRKLWHHGVTPAGTGYFGRPTYPKKIVNVDRILSSSRPMRARWHRSKFTTKAMLKATKHYRRTNPDVISVVPLIRGETIQQRLFATTQFRKFWAGLRKTPLDEFCYQVLRYKNYCKTKPLKAFALTAAAVGSVTTTAILINNYMFKEGENSIYDESNIMIDLTDSFDYSEEDYVIARQLEIYTRTSTAFCVAYILYVIKEELGLDLIDTAKVTDIHHMNEILANIPTDQIQGKTVQQLFSKMGNLTKISQMAHAEGVAAARNLTRLQTEPSILENHLFRNITLVSMHQDILEPQQHFYDIIDKLPQPVTYLQSKLKNVLFNNTSNIAESARQELPTERHHL